MANHRKNWLTFSNSITSDHLATVYLFEADVMEYIFGVLENVAMSDYIKLSEDVHYTATIFGNDRKTGYFDKEDIERIWKRVLRMVSKCKPFGVSIDWFREHYEHICYDLDNVLYYYINRGWVLCGMPALEYLLKMDREDKRTEVFTNNLIRLSNNIYNYNKFVRIEHDPNIAADETCHDGPNIYTDPYIF